ncbi:MAG: DUF2341 domain-containing protein, partial [Thermoplasmata archaeon]
MSEENGEKIAPIKVNESENAIGINSIVIIIKHLIGRGQKMLKSWTKKVYSLCLILMLIISPQISIFLWNGKELAKGATLLDPMATITGPDDESRFGWNVSWVGDVNGDGYDDIIAGAPYNDAIVGNWWDLNWMYRMKLTFNNSDQTETLQDFPVLVNLSSINIDYGRLKPDGTDLRFVDADNQTELKYHIEEWDISGYSYVWVNVTEIQGSPSSEHIWMYYGNSDASNVQDVKGTYDGSFSGVWHMNETSGIHLDA